MKQSRLQLSFKSIEKIKIINYLWIAILDYVERIII